MADWETLQVSTFDSTGHPVTGWGTSGHLTFPDLSGGIAVGADGKLFVQSGRGLATTFVYDQSGSLISSFPLAHWSDGSGIAVDGSGNVYVSSEGGIDKYDATGADLGEVDGLENGEAIAVDTSDEDLYVKHRAGFINHLAGGCPPPDCALVAAFGSGYLGANYDALGIAVDASTHTVFAANDGEPERRGVAVFYARGVLAEATTLSSGKVGGSTADVFGLIDPAGAGPVTGCHFEFVRASSFSASGYDGARSVPCAPGPDYSSVTNVSAGLSGLAENTTYHYRVVAWSVEGLSEGQDRQFSTTSADSTLQPEEILPKEPTRPRQTRRVRCAENPCGHKFHGSAHPRTWKSPNFPATYTWLVGIHSHGHWLPHTGLVGGCVATFRGNGIVARVNGCHGHVKLRYVGAETFTLVWQVFK